MENQDPFACTYLFDHPEYTWPMVYCLETDPKELISLDFKSLKEKMKKPGKFIRSIPLKHPVILHESYALKSEPFRTIGIDKLRERADIVRSNPTFIENLKRAVKENAEEKKLKYISKEDERINNDPHNQLYSGGFLDKNSPDYDIIQKFHTIDWDKRYEQVVKIKDSRFKYFGERLIYQNEPEALPKEAYKRIHTETAERVLRLEEKNFTTIPMAEHLIDSIRAEKDIDKEKLDYMNEVDEMIKEMRVFYESALTGKSKSNEDTDYEIPKFLREGTDAKDLRKKAEEIPKQELPKKRRILHKMYTEENMSRYFNNLRRILRSKLESLDYYEQVVRYQELEKKAYLRLLFQRPIYCTLRSIVYLPINILRYLDRIADRFYLSKIKNEVDVLRNEIKYIQKTRWTK